MDRSGSPSSAASAPLKAIVRYGWITVSEVKDGKVVEVL